jgi:hypothetical protein
MNLREFLLTEAKAKKKSIKKVARRVYHRDYEKTKNKPYRKYDPKQHEHQSLSEHEEPMTGDQMMRLSKFLSHHNEHDADRKLRYDLHLLRLISRETQPKGTEVTTEHGQKIVRYFYSLQNKPSEVFSKFKEIFGVPVDRSSSGRNEITAKFKDKLTGTSLNLRYSPTQQYFVAEYPLHSDTGSSPVAEYCVAQISNVVKFLSEGKIGNKDIFLILVETPGIGAPFGGGAAADQNNGTADFRKDVSGMTDQIVHIRGALANHLRADNHDWTYFENAPSIDDAAKRLVQIINKLPEATGASIAAVQQTAQQVARVYWGQNNVGEQ